MEKLNGMPDFVGILLDRFTDIRHSLDNSRLIKEQPNMLLVNEYNIGQGIMPHVDADAIFGPEVMIVSLLSSCVMTLSCIETGEELDVVLARRSCVVMTGESRYKWKHSISKNAIDVPRQLAEFEPSLSTQGYGDVVRDRRISFTFRSVLREHLDLVGVSAGDTEE